MIFTSSPGCHYAGYFHAAMAIENALKAVLISRDPTIVENGTLKISKFGGRSGHALLDAAKAVLLTLTDAEQRLLAKLEDYVWAGRYTVPAKGDVLYDAKRLDNLRTATSNEDKVLESLVERSLESVRK